MNKTYTTADLHKFRERTGVPKGSIRAEIAGHGQYQTSAKALDEMIHGYWDVPIEKLYAEIKERHGDPDYDTTGLARIEAILILAELEGFATN